MLFGLEVQHLLLLFSHAGGVGLIHHFCMALLGTCVFTPAAHVLCLISANCGNSIITHSSLL